MAEAAPLALPQFGISSFQRIEVISLATNHVPCNVVGAAHLRRSFAQVICAGHLRSSFTHQDDVLLLATNLLEARVSRQEKSLF